MAAKRKPTKKVVTEEKIEEVPVVITEKKEEKEKKPAPKKVEKPKKEAPVQKFGVGSIVYIAKDAEADLNGFKLFPQYKKYTYTVEAYDQISGDYTLRRLNLSLRLPESLILAPSEHAHDTINKMQF